MNDRDLLQKLNNLKTIKPDDNWKNNYQEVLYSQIFAGTTINKSESNLRIIWENITPGKIFLDMAKPVWVTFLAGALILAVGIGGVYASKNSKPGDSLYIAKIISEKAQFVMAFNEKDKAKLGLEFATNRAKEITQVLSEFKEPEDKKGAKVEELTQNFKKEISQVKTRLIIIKAAENKNNQNKEEGLEVFGANLGKTDQGMELSEPVKPAVDTQVQLKVEPSVATTTTKEILNNPDKVLEEAEKMFDEKNINGAIDKLEKAKQIMNQEPENPEKGEIKDVSETATSTQ
ncbi:hypothetical protein KKA93_03470 [Patescibacteria group bacterium]|nr:hypothetical protein [Patescibacteria group bacterium]MBU1663675.1 hypothetical protein [Patescibacteria group bacterium]MBU1933970.1 hypothetical protein [Patescibacteria group bacterium]MBU2007863.1 hypothetical protein [Patescibacteria group bacterium]MBU2233397.1 hypothetical protein [Patescibacteria group bacterium]